MVRERRSKGFGNLWCCYLALNKFVKIIGTNWDGYNIYFQRSEAFDNEIPKPFEILRL